MWEQGSLAAPSTVSKGQASAAFVRWLSAYAYTPLEILKPSLLDKGQLIYVPYFHFATSYRADYTVNIGDIRREQQTVYKTEYENGRAKQVPYTEWVYKTEWRPYLSSGNVSGDFAMKFADRVPQGSAFSTFVNEASWQIGELVPAASLNDPGEVSPFSRSPGKAYDEVAKGALDRKISAQIRGTLPGNTHRDLNYRWNTSNDGWTHVYLPYWRYSWEYQGTTHVALVDGRSADRITGDLPTDVEVRRGVNENLKPLWISLGIGVALALAIAFVGGSAALVPWLLGAIAVAVSGVGIRSLYRRQGALSDVRLLRESAADRLLLSLEGRGPLSDADAIEEDE